jgi:hypothetical protein
MKRKIPKVLKEILTEGNEHFIISGIYFGYPSCCIKSFLEGINYIGSFKRFTVAQDLIMDESGFIPCHKCSIKIIKNSLTKKDIIKNRIHVEEYPNDCQKLTSVEWSKHYNIIKQDIC